MSILNFLEHPNNLAIIGEAGRGKTTASIALIRQLIAKGHAITVLETKYSSPNDVNAYKNLCKDIDGRYEYLSDSYNATNDKLLVLNISTLKRLYTDDRFECKICQTILTRTEENPKSFLFVDDIYPLNGAIKEYIDSLIENGAKYGVVVVVLSQSTTTIDLNNFKYIENLNDNI